MLLLTRQQFNDAVFQRDKHKCVVCGATNDLAAHHILERRLFDDGGYYVENGATVCPEHHMEAEMTTLSVKKIRELCGITNPVMPEHFYVDDEYDKWGNTILPNGSRTRGELFEEEPVQKMLKAAGVLDSFLEIVKYCRTFHATWSPGCEGDDKMHKAMTQFVGKECYASQKRDGETTALYPNNFHARSLDGRHHPSRDWAKALWGRIRFDIPEGWRINGENLYAQHSIGYDDLTSYFEVFSIWDENNRRLPLDDQLEWCEILGLTHVPVVWRGIYDEDALKALPVTLGWDMTKVEGYVISLVESYHFSQARKNLAKYVRKNHVQTGDHWMFQAITPNKLK
jgi:hypothetical protein